jgi:hypothetical protein
MPRDAIEQARRDRNAALIDAMLLAVSVDGRRRVVEREVARITAEG